MSECKHERIRVFYNAETGEAVSLWACTECDYRFVPIAEAESLRAENERLRAEALIHERGRAEDARDHHGDTAVLRAENDRLRAENARLRAVVAALVWQADRDPFVAIGHWVEHGPAAAIIRDIAHRHADAHGPDWTDRDTEYLR